jgi:hypothetical protein
MDGEADARTVQVQVCDQMANDFEAVTDVEEQHQVVALVVTTLA